MLAAWTQLRARASARLRPAFVRLDKHAATRWFRFGFGALFVVFHLSMFSIAGNTRLGVPFDTSPDEEPYYQDIHAPATRGFAGFRQPRHWSRLVVSRWDAQHYEGTALRGFQACPTNPDVPDYVYLDCGLGWLPAWGWVGGHIVSSATGIGADYALVLSSIIAGLALAMLWTSKTIVSRIGRFEAYATFAAVNLFPAGFYIVTPYSEAATLAFGIGGFVALANQRWFLAAFLVGAVTALRLPAASFALALGCALVVAAYQRWKASTPAWWKPLLAGPLCGWGQVITMLVLKVEVGDWWAFFRARKAFGDVRHWDRLWDLDNYIKGFGAQHLDMVIWFASAAVIALTAREVLRRFSPVEATFLAVSSVLTLAFSIVAPAHYWGMIRYLLLCQLTFLGAGSMVRRYPAAFVLWIALCLGFYWNIEMCSYVAQGDPTICPCLSKFIEFKLPIDS